MRESELKTMGRREEARHVRVWKGEGLFRAILPPAFATIAIPAIAGFSPG